MSPPESSYARIGARLSERVPEMAVMLIMVVAVLVFLYKMGEKAFAANARGMEVMSSVDASIATNTEVLRALVETTREESSHREKEHEGLERSIRGNR